MHYLMTDLAELQQELADVAASLEQMRAQVKAMIERRAVVNVAVVTDASGETHVRVD